MSSAAALERRRLVVPAAMTLVLLAVLIGLGVWQLQRLAWKTALIASIDRAEAAPAIRLPPDPPQFAKVSVAGRFQPDKSAFYGDQVRDSPRGPVMGAQLLVPLERDGAPTILVDRGWIPENAEPSTPMGLTSVDGYIRQAEHPGWFSAPDDPAKHRFYTLDPEAIGRALNLSSVAPFTLIALGTGGTTGLPIPAEHLPRPPNDHLSYAITWFGLAAGLLGVFMTYALKKK